MSIIGSKWDPEEQWVFQEITSPPSARVAAMRFMLQQNGKPKFHFIKIKNRSEKMGQKLFWVQKI